MNKTTLAGRILLTFLALFTGVSPYLADWNASHIYNPNWPPHAKFHNAQTMAMAALLGSTSLFFIWRRRRGPLANLVPAVVLVSLYWVSQAIAFTFPGVAWTDPDLLRPGQSLTQFPEQLLLDIVVYVLIAAATLLVVIGMRRDQPAAATASARREPPSAVRAKP